MKKILLGVMVVSLTLAAMGVALANPPHPSPSPCPDERTDPKDCTTPTPDPCPEDSATRNDPKECPTPTPTPPSPTPTTPPPTTPPPPPPSPTPPPVCDPSVEPGPWYGDPRINIDLTGPGDFVVRGGVQRFSGLHRIEVSLDCEETFRVTRYKVRAGNWLRVFLDGELVLRLQAPSRN